MIFETHAHYDDKAFNDDREKLLREMKEAGIERAVNVAASLKGSKDSLKLSKEHDFIYCSMGVHPSEVWELTEEKLEDMEQMIEENALSKGGKVVAVGEIGLDYHYPEPGPKLQKKWFKEQLRMGNRLNLPFIIHSREAARETFDLMKECKAENQGGIIHCYSYSAQMAKEFINLGYYFGIGGVITFKNARKLVEATEIIPLERIVLETDSPYLAPVPYRGERNSSLNLPIIAKQIADIKKIPVEELIQITWENACKVYRFH